MRTVMMRGVATFLTTTAALALLTEASGSFVVHLGGPAVVGSGVSKTEKRDAAGFTEIEVSGALKLDFMIGDKMVVEVTTSAAPRPSR
jgi:hypothetical protein